MIAAVVAGAAVAGLVALSLGMIAAVAAAVVLMQIINDRSFYVAAILRSFVS